MVGRCCVRWLQLPLLFAFFGKSMSFGLCGGGALCTRAVLFPLFDIPRRPVDPHLAVDSRGPANPLLTQSLRCSAEDGRIDRRSLLGTAAALYVASSSQLVTAAAVAAEPRNPTWSLSKGVEMPTLALNTAGLSVEEAELALRSAMAAGIMHVDFHPGKERDGVARVLAARGRSDLFLTTKIRKAAPGTAATVAAEQAQAQIEEDLRVLGVKNVDMLMLRDSPDCATMQAQWAVLERALAAGKTRSLGVINYCQSALDCVLQTAQVKPAVNYFMLHVGMGPDAHGLRSFGEKRGVRTFACEDRDARDAACCVFACADDQHTLADGALGEPGPLEGIVDSPVLGRIGAAHGRSAEEVALRWCVQSGASLSVRPTSDFALGASACREDGSCAAGLRLRGSLFGWTLTDEEMKVLNALTSPDGNPTLFSSSGCPGAFVMPKK